MSSLGDDGIHPLVEKVLLAPNDIQSAIARIGRAIASDYVDKKPLVVITLRGAVIFASDIVRAINPVPEDLEIAFVRASSYGSGTSSSGKVKLSYDDANADGRHILIVEDIVDSGHTAVALREHYLSRGAISVNMVALLSKPSRREVEFEPEYLGFEVPDEFVVGYGLDFDQKLRSLPYVGILKREAYSNDNSDANTNAND